MENVREQYLNAVEAWPLYDTVQIGKGIAAPLGFPGFGAIPAKMPFFNVRTEGEAGSAMCNLESKDSLAFGYHLYAIGLSFRWPLGIVPPAGHGEIAIIGASNPQIPILFQTEVPKHVAMRLQIRQDDKLLATAFLTPESTGPVGIGFTAAADPTGGAVYGGGQIIEGHPDGKGRFPFPEPLIMPRGCTYRVNLEFDDYIRNMLATWPALPSYNFSPNLTDDLEILARATIRVSMMGKREVQQRNNLHA